MPEFERTKSLSKDFVGVILDEYDLKRLGELIRDSGSINDPHLKIEILSGDGEETFTTKDVEFFVSSDMPRQIQSVKIFRVTDSLSCFLYLIAFPRGDIHFNIDGKDRNGALGLYHDLDRELQQKTLRDTRIVNVLQRNWLLQAILVIGLNLLIYWASVTSLDLILNILKRNISELDNSIFYLIVYFIGLICILAFLIKLDDRIIGSIKKLFPILEFSGKLSDPRSQSRSRVMWLIISIIIPLVVGTIASIIANKLS